MQKQLFFCIGKNVVDRSDIYQSILDEGHKAGNHTYSHLNGWKTSNESYFQNILNAAKYIDSNLFRPPYGRITRWQVQSLQRLEEKSLSYDYFKIIMWSLLSGDFDTSLSPYRCAQNVILSAKPGSIIVFHDSAKAWDRMSYALPKVLEYFSKEEYSFKSLA